MELAPAHGREEHAEIAKSGEANRLKERIPPWSPLSTANDEAMIVNPRMMIT